MRIWSRLDGYVKDRTSKWVGRTITGATNQITVENGDGLLGNPKIKLPRTIHTNISFDSGKNILDSYTTGTWTPILEFGEESDGITYSTQIAKYWKIGSIVHFNIQIALTNKGSSEGMALIPNLPFDAAKDKCILNCTMVCNNVTTFFGAPQFFCEISPGSNELFLGSTGSRNRSYLSNIYFANNSKISITGFYWTD